MPATNFEEVTIGNCRLIRGDCLEVLPTLAAGTVDAVVTDPPYAEINRDYGRFSESKWHELMNAVVSNTQRIIRKHGSAVFILQPNSESVGRMRPWLWEFMAKWSRDWNMPQDAWWWNFASPPTVHCHAKNGLMRPSMKACVWLGDCDCYRNQDEIMLKASESTMNDRRIDRHELGYGPSGLSRRHGRALSRSRETGNATPFNVIVCANSDSNDSAASYGHGAGTPYLLAEWWTNYICVERGTVSDWFCGTGTMAVAAIRTGRKFIGIELERKYFDIACKRIEDEYARTALLDGVEMIETQRTLLDDYPDVN